MLAVYRISSKRQRGRVVTSKRSTETAAKARGVRLVACSRYRGQSEGVMATSDETSQGGITMAVADGSESSAILAEVD